jgi:hypothetical protein
MTHLLTTEEVDNLNPLDTSLVVIVFTIAQARILVENNFMDYESFKLFDKRDVSMVAESYGKRPTKAE